MKFFKLIFFFFIIYFIRKFIEMYRNVKRMQIDLEAQKNKSNTSHGPQNAQSAVIDADFKVVD